MHAWKFIKPCCGVTRPTLMLPAWSPQPQSVPGLQSLHDTLHETTDTHAHTHRHTCLHRHTCSHTPSFYVVWHSFHILWTRKHLSGEVNITSPVNTCMIHLQHGTTAWKSEGIASHYERQNYSVSSENLQSVHIGISLKPFKWLWVCVHHWGTKICRSL